MNMEFKTLGRSKVKISTIGMGTWGIGGFESRDESGDEHGITALRRGLVLDMNMIDTAEMYGQGHSEEVVADAISDRRERAFIATKVSPNHLSYDDVITSAEVSLRRLRITCMDLYQVHWPSTSIPIKETMRAMERLVKNGKVRFIGVSNFSVSQIIEAQQALSGEEVVSNQVRYNILDRTIEKDLLPYCQRERITIIAYSPLARKRILETSEEQTETLRRICAKYEKTIPQLALNWLISKPGVVAIPKAVTVEHVEENAQAAGWKLSDDDSVSLENVFNR